MSVSAFLGSSVLSAYPLGFLSLDRMGVPKVEAAVTPAPASSEPLPAPVAPVFEPVSGSEVTRSVTPEGGTVASADGKVSVAFPANAVAENVDVTYRELQRWAWGSNGKRVYNMFELTARAPARGDAAVTQFAQELTITLSIPREQLRGLDPEGITLSTINAGTGAWSALSGATHTWEGTVDPDRRPDPARPGVPILGLTGTLKVTGKTNHFSIFGSQSSPAISGPGTVMNFQTDLNGAAAVAQVPLELPRGGGGFAPRLTLSYSSGSVDEMKNKRDTGSWVGTGWSLSLGAVTYNPESGKWALELSGQGYRLVQGSGQVWKTEVDSGFKVQKNSNDTWEIWDRDGTHYTFGEEGPPQGLQWYASGPLGSCQFSSSAITRYNLTTVQDVQGNLIETRYTPDVIGDCNAATYDRVSNYLTRIDYGKNVNVSSQHRYRINLQLGNGPDGTYQSGTGYIRKDNPGSPYARQRENRVLDYIDVMMDEDASGNFATRIRKYNFAYSATAAGTADPWPAGQLTLTSLTQVGANGSSTLPAMSFSYSTPTTYYDTGDGASPTPCNPCNPASFSWPHLSQVSNGYGGSVSYTYTSTPSIASSPTDIWVRAAVTGRTVSPGTGPDQAYTYSYKNYDASTGLPQYKIIDSADPWQDEYRGFSRAKETDAAGNYHEHFFYTVNTPPDSKNADKLKGKEYAVEWRNSSDTLLRKLENGWEVAHTLDNVAWFLRLDQVDETVGSKTRRTRYAWDDANYFNVTYQKNDGDIGTTADDSTLVNTYNVNSSANIINRVARTRSYAGIQTTDPGGSNLKAETYFFYDGYNSDAQHMTAPAKGNVTRVKSASAVESTYINSYFTYDSYGNKLTEQDPNGNTRSWSYSSSWGNYPTTETYPAIGGASMTETAAWDLGAGVMSSWTDVNSEVVTYEYDTFKRLTKTIKPGDTSGSPTLAYNYNSWGTLNSQNLESVLKISSSETRWSKQFFDGVGRVIQVQSQGETEGATTYTILDATTTYSSRGMVDKSYAPQKLNSTSVSGYYSSFTGWRFTSYAYDGIGRVTTQTNPDETTVTHAYSDWQDSVTNPRGYKKRYSNDAFGRLVTVEEYNDATPATVYATTTYAYDTLGNLTAVEDAAGNDTSMSYNALSRKTGMTDPDMGTWSYSYDSNGNLTYQNDAKSQTIAMTYDVLNRITAKDYPSGTPDVAYTYDSVTGGNKGKGRLTSMTDGPGSASYIYDARGRVSSETKVINSDSKTFSYTYDSADRVATVTYPDSEVVTQSYNGRGLPSTLSGSSVGNLVTASAYNALAMTSMTFGNGVVTTYNFYGIEQSPSSPSNFGRLYQVTAVKDSTTLQNMTHSWDANGNLSSRTNSVGTSETESFSYDFLDRLTGVSNAYSESYAYNTIGNITSKNSVSYTYPTAGAARPHAVTAVGSTSYGYDGNGNMAARGSQTLSWDADNRLTKVSTGQPAGISSTGLVAYWKFDETSGTSAADSSGNGHTGTLTSGPTWAAGKYGNALSFDGTDDYVTVDDIGVGENTTFTVAAWVKPTATQFGCIYCESDAVSQELSLVSQTNGKFWVYLRGTGTLIELDSYGTTYSAGTWYHLAFIANGATSYDFYVNGVRANYSTSNPGTRTFTRARIGGDYWNGAPNVPFPGVIDDLRLYSRALSAAEIAALSVGEQATYTYDGNGARATQTTLAGETIAYHSKFYEKSLTTGEVTKSYFFGGKLVAQKKGSENLVYFHQDHLTGTSVMSDSTGASQGTVKYFPFGGTRSTSGTIPTDKKFTGQRLDGTGLYFYNARYYDAEIGRFVSADTVIPNFQNPQSWNRYTYTINNPLGYTDPSGHCEGPAAAFRRMPIFSGLCRGADAVRAIAPKVVTATTTAVAEFVEEVKSVPSRVAATPETVGDFVGVESIDIVASPRLGVPMPVIEATKPGESKVDLVNRTIDVLGQDDTQAITLPGVVIARNDVSAETLRHEGIHFEEWFLVTVAFDPFLWHAAYMAEYVYDFAWYFDGHAAYQESSFERRAEQYINPSWQPDHGRQFWWEEIGNPGGGGGGR